MRLYRNKSWCLVDCTCTNFPLYFEFSFCQLYFTYGLKHAHAHTCMNAQCKRRHNEKRKKPISFTICEAKFSPIAHKNSSMNVKMMHVKLFILCKQLAPVADIAALSFIRCSFCFVEKVVFERHTRSLPLKIFLCILFRMLHLLFCCLLFVIRSHVIGHLLNRSLVAYSDCNECLSIHDVWIACKRRTHEHVVVLVLIH